MTRILLFPLVFGLALAASAQASPGVIEQTQRPVSAFVPEVNVSAETDKSPSAASELADRNCLKHTGSRISPRADPQGRKCISASGRSYSKDDLDRTGEIDLADALRRLDPAIR
ncbi:MAG: hypothetical protein ABI858_01395 [Pseudoxanthomonas sp.]